MITELQFTDNLIYSKLSLLSSEPLKQELLLYIDYLLNRQFTNQGKKSIRKFGCGKGMFVMSPDFDKPLEDFKEYMP
jgi:hypothetical protein